MLSLLHQPNGPVQADQPIGAFQKWQREVDERDNGRVSEAKLPGGCQVTGSENHLGR